MHNPPEDIIQYKRNRALYKEHLKRVRGQNALIDSNIPKSLGLKHLQTRAKKKQLMEDRSQMVAKDNKLLMERMTAVSECCICVLCILISILTVELKC